MESPSGKCEKLHTVAASSNTVQITPGPQPANIFWGAGQNGCNLLLYLTTKHDFENFGGVMVQLPIPWLRAWTTRRAQSITACSRHVHLSAILSTYSVWGASRMRGHGDRAASTRRSKRRKLF